MEVQAFHRGLDPSACFRTDGARTLIEHAADSRRGHAAGAGNVSDCGCFIHRPDDSRFIGFPELNRFDRRLWLSNRFDFGIIDVDSLFVKTSPEAGSSYFKIFIDPLR